MTKSIRWGLAAGLAAVLALAGNVQAQSSYGGTEGSGSRGDTGGPSPTGADRTSADRETTPGGGAAGTSSDPGVRSGGTAAGADASGRQAAAGQVDKKLQERLERIHATNKAEVEKGQLGIQNAESPDVKEFAEHMRTDHEKADEKLSQVAQSAGVASLDGDTFQKETEKARRDLDKLQAKTGRDFDKAFMSQMVKDHEKGLKEVEKARDDARKANHTELASMLEQTHRGMKGHLDHAKQVEKSLDQAGRGQRAAERGPATGGTGAGAPSDTGTGTSGSRGDTGGPPPRGEPQQQGQQSPSGGATGTSSDPGQPSR